MDASKIQRSALWAVVMFNMAFADIVGFLHPGTLQGILEGNVGFQPTGGMLLGFSLLIEVPIAMVFLSLVLAPAADRWLSALAAVLTTAFIVGGGSATASYAFFAAIEIAAMAVIVRSAWLPHAGRRTHRQAAR